MELSSETFLSKRNGETLVRQFLFSNAIRKEIVMKNISPQLTAANAAKIKALLQGTKMNHAQIASHLGGMNQGRVSEVKTGKRFPMVVACSLVDALMPE